MEPAHHDRVLAIVSHLRICWRSPFAAPPDDLAEGNPSGSDQFRRVGVSRLHALAASDPVMWRISSSITARLFAGNAGALMEDAQAMARAVRWGDAA